MSSAGDDQLLVVEGILPGRLWSLWEIMKKFETNDFWRVVADLSGTSLNAKIRHLEIVSTDHKQGKLYPALDRAAALCIALNIDESLALVGRFRADVSDEKTLYSQVATLSAALLDLIRSELSKQLLFRLAPQEAAFFAREKLFGEAIDTAFPSARMDIKEAGSSMACERYNAAIYHLMSAAEIGLRALARDRRVKLIKKQQHNPLELAQWGELIEAIEGKIGLVKKWRHSLRRERALQFYNSALIEVRAFNDGYRRHVMHARTTVYSQDEALALLGHVRRFLGTLTTVMSEDKITPIVWRADDPVLP